MPDPQIATVAAVVHVDAVGGVAYYRPYVLGEEEDTGAVDRAERGEHVLPPVASPPAAHGDAGLEEMGARCRQIGQRGSCSSQLLMRPPGAGQLLEEEIELCRCGKALMGRSRHFRSLRNKRRLRRPLQTLEGSL